MQLQGIKNDPAPIVTPSSTISDSGSSGSGADASQKVYQVMVPVMLVLIFIVIAGVLLLMVGTLTIIGVLLLVTVIRPFSKWRRTKNGINDPLTNSAIMETYHQDDSMTESLIGRSETFDRDETLQRLHESF
jgi:UPF0716 family protein affecting phage T7 exclusion